jgi:hypothetical protein
MFQGRAAPDSDPQRTYAAVEIPALPAELEPVFRPLADDALADWVVRQRELPSVGGLPDQPPPDWLAGIYLATASQYQSVADYWNGLNGWVESMREGEERLFSAAFEARMDSAGITGEERATLAARALAGFQSALPERDAAYDALAALSQAALDLHEFLLEREEEIEYTPAAGGLSRDPVLEAVPATAALGEEMWDRVDRITAALEGMNALTDRVTTERLVAITLDQLGTTTVH